MQIKNPLVGGFLLHNEFGEKLVWFFNDERAVFDMRTDWPMLYGSQKRGNVAMVALYEKRHRAVGFVAYGAGKAMALCKFLHKISIPNALYGSIERPSDLDRLGKIVWRQRIINRIFVDARPLERSKIGAGPEQFANRIAEGANVVAGRNG